MVDIFSPKPHHLVNGTPEYKLTTDFFNDRRKYGPHVSELINQLSDIFGPLNVAQRWELLGEMGLERSRRNASLQGSAAETAISLVDIGARSYPENVLVLQIALNSLTTQGVSEQCIPPEIASAVTFLLQTPASSKNTPK